MTNNQVMMNMKKKQKMRGRGDRKGRSKATSKYDSFLLFGFILQVL